jgi:hypothetical protein
MSAPLKRTGFAQALYTQKADRKEIVGTLRITKDGRAFRYAKAGASALAEGKMSQAPAIASGIMNQACPVTAAGEIQITLTITAGVAYAADYFVGGYFQVNDEAAATGEGQSFLITSSTAVGAAGTSITISLAEPLKTALAATSEFTLVASPWMAVVEAASARALATGISPMDITAAYYFWAQTKGMAAALINGTPPVGTALTLSHATAGALDALDASYYFTVGVLHGTVGVSTEYKPVHLTID